MNDAEELINLTERLLASIGECDWQTYTEICDPTLTAIEPESDGLVIEGMPFHKFYFDLDSGPPTPKNVTILGPHVRVMGDVAVVAYSRLVQHVAENGPVTSRFHETRVWQRQDGKWRHVHFHRS